MSGAPANIIGNAPVTSATARRLFSPTRCAVNRFSMRCVFAITPTTGRFIASVSFGFCRAQVGECVVQPPESGIENRTRRGEVEAQPGLAARPELLAGTCEDPRAFCDPGCNIFGRQPGSGEIEPRQLGAVETHRAGAGRCGFNAGVEQIAACGEIRQ